MREVISAIFRDIKHINQARNSIGVLLFLPTSFEYKRPIPQPWMKVLVDEAKKNELYFIDLTDDIKKIPAGEIRNLFIPDGAINYDSAAGHYSEEGNRYIADILYEKLKAIPEISEKLN